MTGRIWLFVAAVLAPWTLSAAESAFPPEQIEFFEKHIRPVLVARCQKCHGPTQQEAGLRLDTHAHFLRGIEGSPIVAPGNVEQSRLVKVIRYDGDVQMPPEGKLPESELQLLVEWVKRGAPWPADTSPAASTSKADDWPARIAAARATHWSYQPIRQPSLPKVQDPTWCRAPIDRFILAKLEAADLRPAHQADGRTLVRRLYFDFIGLPPTAAEVDNFVSDYATHAEQAYERLVESLLASPRYGERWGRHWLDLARYADTKGYAFQQERRFPYAYTYRDYVIRAFNDDIPYDQFVLEQLAADQLPPRDDGRSLAALGFLTVGRRFNNIHEDADDRIDVVTRGLLGLSTTCARCHDHKFDPIPTDDYYSLYGVFRSSNEPGELPLIGRIQPSAEHEEFKREYAKRVAVYEQAREEEAEKLRERLRTRVGDFLAAVAIEQRGREAASEYKFDQGEPRGRILQRWKDYLARAARSNDALFLPWRQLLAVPDGQLVAEYGRLKSTWSQGEKNTQINSLIRTAFEKRPPKSIFDVVQAYHEAFDSVRVQWQAVLAKAAQDKQPAPEKLADPDAEALRQAIYGAQSPASFTAVEAQALFEPGIAGKLNAIKKKADEWEVSSPAAPPRAMVLVDASTPFNPDVFIRGNPDRRGKSVPRQFLAIVAGDDRQPFAHGGGRLDLARAIVDPGNPLTARVLVNRVWQHHFGAGIVRTPSDFGARGELPTHPELLDYLAARFMADGWSIKALHRAIVLSSAYRQASGGDASATLAVAADSDNRLLGRMNRRRLEFEPTRDAILYVSGQLVSQFEGRPVEISKQGSDHRRTIYAFVDRQDLPDIFRTFDFASPDTSTEQRPQTTVPQQALFALNSPLVHDMARAIAAHSDIASAPSANEQIDRLYRRVLSRSATENERRLAERFLATAQSRGSEPPVWQYGYGGVDATSERVTTFEPLAHWTGTQWQCGSKFPDDQFGHLMLRNNGGHPGREPNGSTIARWTAPLDGSIAVSGELAHANSQGDGVRARVVSSRAGVVGQWVAHNAKATSNVAQLEVRRGDTLDFVVDCRDGTNSDSYTWSPRIALLETAVDRIWDFSQDFHGPPPAPLSPLERLAQVLMLTNEFLFVD